MNEKLTLAEKVWRDHVVRAGAAGEPDLLYIDFQLLHEVTSPQAFDGLRLAGRTLRHPELHLATEDHNVPTRGIATGALSEIADETSRTQVSTLRDNCAEFGVRLHSMGDAQQGIVHTVGPQLGITQPGMTIVCGDSHTSTHGAFGSIAMGIGTSEVEHVMATQTLSLQPFKTMAIEIDGQLPTGVGAKDVILAIIAKIGTGGGQGHIIEYRGEAVRAMSMEQRMTLCNMSIEAGARAGMVAPDETTFDYVRGREFAPAGADWDAAVDYWRTLPTDPPLAARVPNPEDFGDDNARAAAEKALRYMDLTPGTALRDVPIDTVFLGSCTNARIEDLRDAAAVVRGRRIHAGTRMLVVPSSAQVKLQAEQEGLDAVFREFGAEWRTAGCSMCLGMNPDQLRPGERSASTSNRNFEGRQGPGGRTHLVSPQVAAATAVVGRLAAPADLEPLELALADHAPADHAPTARASGEIAE